MSPADYVIAVLRAALVIAPAGLIAHVARRRFSALSGVIAAVCEAVLVLAWLVGVSEALGLLDGLKLGWLIGVSWLMAAVVVLALRPGSAAGAAVAVSEPGAPPARDGRRVSWGLAAVAVWVAVSEWVFATANVLGSGMASFDVLWYHMPFAAAFAQTGSVRHILFTQADPAVAYYPADSELVHAIGIVALGNDFLSPLLNLGWMALALTAAWCVGIRWRVQAWTLCSGAVVLALPVLSATQAGEAFNDTVGLAALAAALALMSGPARGRLELLAVGLALGLAVGTKYTFIVPAVVLALGAIWSERRSLSAWVTATWVVGGALLTGGWWYLRALIDTGNPLGLSQTLGPVHLSGAASPLADASRETVLTALHQVPLSRFAPGLAHAFGPLWPLVLLLVLAAALLSVAAVRTQPLLSTCAIGAGLAAVAYLVTPAGGDLIQQSLTTFTVNLRYLTPALELGLLALPPILAVRAPRLLVPAGLLLVAIALSAQLEHNIWPTQFTRHVAFLVLCGLAGPLVVLAARRRRSLGPAGRVLTAVALVLGLLGAGEVAQRHYFARRYLAGAGSTRGLGAIDRWAQGVSHTSIALYGTVEQYPLYGARDTNTVTYLGQPAPHGGYRPITGCTRWRRAVQGGRYRYLVLTPGPTGEVSPSWYEADAGLVEILHPTAADWVFRIRATQPIPGCPAGA